MRTATMRDVNAIAGRHRLTRLVPAAVGLAGLVVIAAHATADAGTPWSALGKGTAVGGSATMPAGARPVAALAPGTSSLKVSWGAATFKNGAEVAEYLVSRTAAGQTTQVCDVKAPLDTCQDTPPLQTPVTYTVTPRQSLWQGPASPASEPAVLAAAVVDACTVVTPADAATLAGETVAQSNGGAGVCSYTGAAHSITVFVETLTSEAVAEASLANVLNGTAGGAPLTTVTGVGSKAMSFSSSTIIAVDFAKNAKICYISLTGADVSSVYGTLLTVAQHAAARL
jgi:hypothetical protein